MTTSIREQIEVIIFGRPETTPAMQEKEYIRDWEYRCELDRKSWQITRLESLICKLQQEAEATGRKKILDMVLTHTRKMKIGEKTEYWISLSREDFLALSQPQNKEEPTNQPKP